MFPSCCHGHLGTLFYPLEVDLVAASVPRLALEPPALIWPSPCIGIGWTPTWAAWLSPTGVAPQPSPLLRRRTFLRYASFIHHIICILSLCYFICLPGEGLFACPPLGHCFFLQSCIHIFPFDGSTLTLYPFPTYLFFYVCPPSPYPSTHALVTLSLLSKRFPVEISFSAPFQVPRGARGSHPGFSPTVRIHFSKVPGLTRQGWSNRVKSRCDGLEELIRPGACSAQHSRCDACSARAILSSMLPVASRHGARCLMKTRVTLPCRVATLTLSV